MAPPPSPAVFFYDHMMDQSERLLDAVRTRNLGAVQVLLAEGSDPDAREPDPGGGQTALALAVANGDLEIAMALLDRGASVDAASHFEWTPIRAAIEECDPEMVRLLVKHGADTNPSGHRASLLSEAIQQPPTDLGQRRWRFCRYCSTLARPLTRQTTLRS